MRLPFALLASLLFLVSLAGAAAAVDPDDASLDVVTRYLTANRLRQEKMRGIQMEVEIVARLPKLEKQGKLRVLRRISKLGQITFKQLGFTGDNTVKQEVIARYLTEESQARENPAIAITPANYKFQLKAKITDRSHTTYIFQLTPRKKLVGLFKGELWLDGATGMPLKETGQLVKSPSVFLKKVQFEREYELLDGIAFPKRLDSQVETRVVGKAELNIRFSNFAAQENDENEEIASGTGEAGPADRERSK